MFSDTGITFAGHTITGLQFLGVGALLLGIAVLLLAFSRERRTALKRSIVTDELAIHMGRIADALDRIANQSLDRASQRAADRAMRRESRTRAEVAPDKIDAPTEAIPEKHGVSYSMFGR
jgi:hypothetical protein